MTREELLSMPEYWVAQIQTEIYRCADQFMEERHMNRTQFAEYLGVSKGYVTQLLSGDYNYSIEKLVELSLKIGYVPQVSFEEIERTLQMDAQPVFSIKGRSMKLFSSYTSQADANKNIKLAA
jgi:transcriptional regulator with XRE-family HTH domain